MEQTKTSVKLRAPGDWRMIALGVEERMRRALEKLCVQEPAMRFTGVTGSLTTLLFALEESRPDLVVIDEQSLGEESVTALSNIHHASPCTRMLIIGDTVDAVGRWEVLQLGVAGHLRRAGSCGQIARAIAAVRRGEYWLSRSQSSQLLTRLAADEIRQHGEVPDLSVLTPQENRVLQQCLVGQSNKEIARALGITEQTVKIHLQHIFQKLGVRRRADLLLRRWVCREKGLESRRPYR
jgi:DNA-binding NarL/FixJ family response regulator